MKKKFFSYSYAFQNHMNGRAHAFIPCVEPNVGQEVFMTNDPWTMMKTEDLVDVPIMIGMNLDETSFMAPSKKHTIELILMFKEFILISSVQKKYIF